MKIRMKDFLCYTDSTFDFGNTGVALLSGPSGVGKTSILRGIFFALFGEGNKLQASGSTSCRVELEFDNLNIIRTKKPNRLVVNDVHEDESGQEIINKIFGDTFKVTGYIQQNNLNSFILMSPVEKLSFLEKFAFRDVDLGKIKGRCKAYILQTSDALVGVVSQLGMAKNVLEEMEEPNETIFPLKCKKTEREKAIKNERIKLKNSITLISRSTKDHKILSQEISDLRIFEAETKVRKEALFDLEDTIRSINKEISEIRYEGDDVFESLKKSLEVSVALRELYSLEKQLSADKLKLEEMRSEEEDLMKNRLIEYDGSLWKEYSKNELLNTIDELKKCISDLEQIEYLKGELKKYIPSVYLDKNKLELLQKESELEDKQRLYDKLESRQGLYSCPSCSVQIRLTNDKLILATEGVGEDYVDVDLVYLKEQASCLKQRISVLKRTIQEDENKLKRKDEIECEITKISETYEEVLSLQGVKDDLEYLRDYQTCQIELEKKKKEITIDIKDGKFSSSYFTFKKSLEKLQHRKDLLQSKCVIDRPSENEEEIRDRISDQKQKKEKLYDLEKRLDCAKDTSANFTKILEKVFDKHKNKYGRVQNIEELEKNVLLEENKLLELEEKKRKHDKVLHDIEEWERYQTSLENYKGWELKVKELEVAEKTARNEYASATKLKDKVLEAESIAMFNIIDSINTHARLYLDSFFPDNPISVNLQAFKETKKSTKPQINIEIEYKGMEADLNMLSGGELSRVILAYTMALAEMFNTPLLLLDECTSSLDQDLSEIVFNAIRENFNGKMTLLIAHQVVTGTFDKIIRLGAIND